LYRCCCGVPGFVLRTLKQSIHSLLRLLVPEFFLLFCKSCLAFLLLFQLTNFILFLISDLIGLDALLLLKSNSLQSSSFFLELVGFQDGQRLLADLVMLDACSSQSSDVNFFGIAVLVAMRKDCRGRCGHVDVGVVGARVLAEE